MRRPRQSLRSEPGHRHFQLLSGGPSFQLLSLIGLRLIGWVARLLVFPSRILTVIRK